MTTDEAKEWDNAYRQAQAEGTFFVGQPFHCAIDTKAIPVSRIDGDGKVVMCNLEDAVAHVNEPADKPWLDR